jgi:hypothetical protein
VDQSFITGVSGGTGLAVDDKYIYWTQGGSMIGRANLDGTGVNQFFITGLTAPQGIAVVPVPEPGTGLLVMAGVLGLAIKRRRTA